MHAVRVKKVKKGKWWSLSRLFSSEYDIKDNGKHITTIIINAWSYYSEFEISGYRYEIHKKGSDYLLMRNTEVVCRAKESSGIQVKFNHEEFVLVRPTIFSFRHYVMLKRDYKIGEIFYKGFSLRDITVNLPDYLPMEVRIFIFALVNYRWRGSSGD